MLDIASGPDLLRLLVLPFFAYVAWLDIRTRRVANRTWYPLAALAVIALVWDCYIVFTGDVQAVNRQTFVIQVVLSVGIIIPLAYLFWRIGGFGGADAKAFMVIALLLPVFPTYELWRLSLGAETLGPFLNWLPGATYNGIFPMVGTTLGVFSVTVLSNTVVMGALYPVALGLRNATVGYFSPRMFVAKPVRWQDITAEYGTLLGTPDESGGGLLRSFSFQGLDVDALRMYLRWRGLTLEQLRENPELYRNPASLPAEPNPPGDGSIPVDGWEQEPAISEVTTEPDRPVSDVESTEAEDAGETATDPWGAAAFLEDIEGNAYGTTPEALRDGLDTLVSDDVVWLSPGIPFLVPMFVGLVLAFTYGDLLFALFEGLGLGPGP